VRIGVNIFKLGLWLALWTGILALTFVVALVHYEGLSSGFRLLNFENMPVGRDRLFGPYFDAFSPAAGFIEWVSFAMTALIMVMSWLACHFAFAIARLLPDAGEYYRQGEAAQLWRAVGFNALPVVVSVGLLIWLMQGDAAIFQFRALAAQRGIDVDADSAGALAAASIPTIAALPADAFRLASIAFLTNQGLWMYLAMGVGAPVALELVGAAALETLALVIAAIENAFAARQATPEQVEPEFYGYDAAGMPVYDPDTPIAFHTDQTPVSPVRSESSEPDAAGGGVDEQAVSTGPDGAMARPAPVRADAPTDASAAVGEPVIGGRGQLVSFADALTQPDRYHVTRRPRAIYARAYWDALNRPRPGPGGATPVPDGDAEADEDRKEAA
jgi:hypothetical protein